MTYILTSITDNHLNTIHAKIRLMMNIWWIALMALPMEGLFRVALVGGRFDAGELAEMAEPGAEVFEVRRHFPHPLKGDRLDVAIVGEPDAERRWLWLLQDQGTGGDGRMGDLHYTISVSSPPSPVSVYLCLFL